MEAAGKSVCVTGAGGFIASWLVKLLLSRGHYAVRGTVRDPGDCETVENKLRNLVDVRDVAGALLLTYEKPEASGRYLCSSHKIKASDMIHILKTLYPTYAYPKNFTEVENIIYSSDKLQKLGWTFRPAEETLRDSVESYQSFGILN
ncbi:hypothetical protein PR202_gb27933 [Eleusine coracana subsp. coracana]|uniref:NAD-dependent epimerase/dehydratase domain-containing protein n=1 Tax=Eleusine coracana subsp. coracana TaxID=191504 RepID=A0AAV5FVY3_ELECO|nr:hypothetical protein PR202_gb27933 [Eleusine coracana subsp. coracana]